MKPLDYKSAVSQTLKQNNSSKHWIKRNTESFFPQGMDKIENGNFSHRRILFWEFINTQDTWKGRWCYNMFRKSFFFFFFIISKLRHAIHQHANVSWFSEHLCNHTLEVKIVPVLEWKFIPYSKVLCFLHKKMRVYLFFVASLSCHCGSLKMYKK